MCHDFQDATAWTAGSTLARKPLTPDEVRALIQACSGRAPIGIRNRALIVALYRGGLRISEALALKPILPLGLRRSVSREVHLHWISPPRTPQTRQSKRHKPASRATS